MKTDLEKLKRLYVNLDYDQRKSFKNFADEYEDDTLEKRDKVKENLQKSLGPIASATCPLCGK